MNIQVKLQAIIEEMEIQFEESRTFLNIKTGEIIVVTSDDLTAEDEESIDHLPDWEQEDRKVANDVVENFENYKELPTKYELNEYEMMEDFCLTVSDQRKQDILLSLLKGKGVLGGLRTKSLILKLRTNGILIVMNDLNKLRLNGV